MDDNFSTSRQTKSFVPSTVSRLACLLRTGSIRTWYSLWTYGPPSYVEMRVFACFSTGTELRAMWLKPPYHGHCVMATSCLLQGAKIEKLSSAWVDGLGCLPRVDELAESDMTHGTLRSRTRHLEGSSKDLFTLDYPCIGLYWTAPHLAHIAQLPYPRLIAALGLQSGFRSYGCGRLVHAKPEPSRLWRLKRLCTASNNPIP